MLRVPVEQVKGKVDLVKMMEMLAARGLNNVMVETGAKLNASLLAAGVVDEIVAYVGAEHFWRYRPRPVCACPKFLISLDERTN